MFFQIVKTIFVYFFHSKFIKNINISRKRRSKRKRFTKYFRREFDVELTSFLYLYGTPHIPMTAYKVHVHDKHF